MTLQTPVQGDDLRVAAITRLRKKREFWQHVMVYVVVNGAINLIWLLTMPGGFYWPLFPLFGWGIGLAFHAMDAYAPALPSEDRIEREMHKLSR